MIGIRKFHDMQLHPAPACSEGSPSGPQIFCSSATTRCSKCSRGLVLEAAWLDNEPIRLPVQAVDSIDSRPNDIRSPRFHARRSRYLSGLGEVRAVAPRPHPVT